MPDLSFVLPHWLYWSGLVVLPLLAMYLVGRQRRAGPRPPVSLAVGYLLLVTAGFVGIHRFYVRSRRGVLYVPLFAAIVLVNVATRDAREAISRVEADLLVAEFDLERAQDAAEAGEDAESRLAEARAAFARTEAEVAAARATFKRWSTVALAFAVAIAVMLVIDAALLPRLIARCNAREMAEVPASEDEVLARIVEAEAGPPPREARGPTRWLAELSRRSGEFVAYWSVIAVFAYYYEVIARYIFNSPTNWVHEGMFMMFGMQFLISGAYAYLTDSHVRVDVLYVHMSPRKRALTDVLTSLFFFIFAGTLLATGWIFMVDSIEVWEVSFTEWAIQYWPVKITIVLGAALILLQGLAKLVGDLATLFAPAR